MYQQKYPVSAIFCSEILPAELNFQRILQLLERPAVGSFRVLASAIRIRAAEVRNGDTHSRWMADS